MFEDLSRELKLTVQQQQDVKSILDVEASRLLQLKKSSLDASAKKEQYRLILQQTLDRLGGVLTVEQQQGYVRFRTEKKDKLRTKKQQIKKPLPETEWVSDE
ncbi:MAG: hypothetical protein ACR2PT_17610 [Endozoicomonas sp.]